MKRLFLLILMIVGASIVRSQSITKIDSHGSNIILTIWSSDVYPTATVLVVPGWGGGL